MKYDMIKSIKSKDLREAAVSYKKAGNSYEQERYLEYQQV